MHNSKSRSKNSASNTVLSKKWGPVKKERSTAHVNNVDEISEEEASVLQTNTMARSFSAELEGPAAIRFMRLNALAAARWPTHSGHLGSSPPFCHTFLARFIVQFRRASCLRNRDLRDWMRSRRPLKMHEYEPPQGEWSQSHHYW